tara:strand:- start:2890 stop:3225 length:336 start_codon:yes stop_codon:yes gene_type:complete
MRQIFKNVFPLKEFVEFLKLFCLFEKKCYKITKTTFKKYRFENKVVPFFEKLKPYYFDSKIFYLTRDLNYRNFVTVIRQISKLHHLPFTSKIKYSKSSYNIIYFIYPEKWN